MRKKFACLSLAIVLCMSLVAVMAISFNGFHVNAEETKEEKAARFTARDRFTYNRVLYDLEEYPDLYGKEDSIWIDRDASGSTVVKQSDAILDIVPYEYFTQEGKYNYAGEVYGFFIDNFRDKRGIMHSIVLVYKFTRGQGKVKSDIEFHVGMKPLFEYEYITVTKPDGMYLSYSYLPEVPYNKDNYQYAQSYYKEDRDNNEPMVVAAPQKGLHVCAEMIVPIHKYYIQKIHSNLEIDFLQNCQKSDEGYDIDDDKGFAIMATYFDYYGAYIKQEGSIFDVIKDVGLGSLKYAISYAAGKVLGNVMFFIDAGEILFNALYENAGKVEIINRKNNIELYNMIGEQKEKNEYNRTGAIKLKDENGQYWALRPSNLSYGVQEEFTAHYIFGDHGEPVNYRTRLLSSLLFTVQTVDQKESTPIECKFEDFIGDQYREIYEDEVTINYETDDFHSYLSFTPKNSGEYEIFTQGNYDVIMNLYADSAQKNMLARGEEFNNKNKRIRIQLEKGVTYYLYLSTKGVSGRRSYPVIANYIPEKLQLDETRQVTLTKDKPVIFSYLAPQTNNYTLSVKTGDNYDYAALLKVLNVDNEKTEILAAGKGSSLSFLGKKECRYYFEVMVANTEQTGTQFAAELLLQEGETIGIGMPVEIKQSVTCFEFDTQISGQYLINYIQNSKTKIEVYDSNGDLLNFDTDNKIVTLEKGSNFINVIDEDNQKIEVELYTGEQAIFKCGTEKVQEYKYALLNGCEYIKLIVPEGMYHFSCDFGGEVENTYFNDFENPISLMNGNVYLQNDTYYVKVSGNKSGTLIVSRVDFADEYNIILQNHDKTPQTDEVLKGNEYEICILDKAGKAIELEEILFVLQYNGQTIEQKSIIFIVPLDTEIGETIAIIGDYKGNKITASYTVIAPYDLTIGEKIENIEGDAKIFYEVKLEKNGILNNDYVKSIKYQFKNGGKVIAEGIEEKAQQQEDGTIIFKKDFTEVKRYSDIEIVVTLECKNGNKAFSYTVIDNHKTETQNMPNSNAKFSSEKIYLTHNTVTKEISYTISKDVKLFVLQGSAGSSYKIKLNIEDGTTPLLIYLVDFNSQVSRGDVILAQGRTISIWSYGDSRLTGGNGTMPSNTPNKGENVRDFANRTNNDHDTSTGGAAIKANDVYLHGDSLFLQGGRGANGSGVGIKNIYTTVLYTYFTGERGGNGGAGIMALGKVDIQIRGLEVYGGTGGNGNDGLSFVLKNPQTTSYGEGYAGMYGGNGGDGGAAIQCKSLQASVPSDAIIYLCGGNAGSGGDGGAGRYGLDGSSRENTLDGENGYDGATGGDGGASGYVIEAESISLNNFKTFTLHGGNAGSGGDGGKGGRGGDGENNGTWFSTGGKGGNGGRGGYGGDVYPLVITNLPGSYSWNIIPGKAGTGGSGGAGGDGGIGGNGGWAGHKGEDGIPGADGGVGTII